MAEQTAVSDETVTIEEERLAGPPPGPPVEPPPERELWPWLLVLLVLVLGGIAVVYFATRDDTSARQRTTTTFVQASPQRSATTAPRAAASARVTVPRLVGLTAPAALRRLRDIGLVGTTHNVFSQKPRNVVLAQAPGAARKLAKGATVTLNVSKGPKAVPVPDVVGQSLADALKTLSTQGLKKTRIVRVPSAQPAGQVVAQRPRAGAQAQPTVVVRLNVAARNGGATTAPTVTGTAPSATTGGSAATPAPPSGLVRVPDLEGKTLSDARALLRRVGLVIEIRRVPNVQPLGTVVAQAKRPGTRLKRGSHLLVTVSTGRSPAASSSSSGSGSAGSTSTTPVSVPDVVGEDETTATQDLRSAGLTVRVVDRDTADVSQDGVVVEQSPAASSSAKPGSTVTLYVGRYVGG